MKNFEELTQIKDDPRFGDITILFNQSNPSEKVMKKIKICESQEEYEMSKEQVSTRNSINHSNILQLRTFQFNDENLETSVYFDYPDEIIDLSQLKLLDSIYLFRDILEAIIYLQQQKMVHGDIRPEYISYSKPTNKYLLLDRLLDISTPLQCQLNNIHRYKSLYMAPKIFDELMKKSKKIRQNSYKSELFSLGMISLSVFEDLKNIQEFYSFEDCCFKQNEFEQKLELISKRNYSLEIREFIKLLYEEVLVYDEAKRINPKKIKSKIQKNKTLFQLFFPNQNQPSQLQNEDTDQSISDSQITNQTLNYYNPFDFLKSQKLGVIEFIARKNSTEDILGNSQENDDEVKKLFMTNNSELFFNMKKKDQNENFVEDQKLELVKDKRDKLPPIKFLNLKYNEINSNFPNLLSSIRQARVSTKLIDEEQVGYKNEDAGIGLISEQSMQKNKLTANTEVEQIQKELNVNKNLMEHFEADVEEESNSSQARDTKSKGETEKKNEEELKTFLKSIGIPVQKEILNEELNDTLEQVIQKSQTDEICVYDESVVQEENDATLTQRRPSGLKLKQFLQTQPNPLTMTTPQKEMEKFKFSEKQKIYKSFTFIKPKFQQKKDQVKIQQKRFSSNIRIEGNYSMMKGNANKRISNFMKKNSKEQNENEEQSPKIIFNINRNQSHSQEKKSNTEFEARSKSQRILPQDFSLINKIEKLTLKNFLSPVLLDGEDKNFSFIFSSEENVLVKPDIIDRESKDLPSDIILKDINIKIFYKNYEKDHNFSNYVNSEKSIGRISISSQESEFKLKSIDKFNQVNSPITNQQSTESGEMKNSLSIDQNNVQQRVFTPKSHQKQFKYQSEVSLRYEKYPPLNQEQTYNFKNEDFSKVNGNDYQDQYKINPKKYIFKNIYKQHQNSNDKIPISINQYKNSNEKIQIPINSYKNSNEKIQIPNNSYKNSNEKIPIPNNQYKSSNEKIQIQKESQKNSNEKIPISLNQLQEKVLQKNFEINNQPLSNIQVRKVNLTERQVEKNFPFTPSQNQKKIKYSFKKQSSGNEKPEYIQEQIDNYLGVYQNGKYIQNYNTPIQQNTQEQTQRMRSKVFLREENGKKIYKLEQLNQIFFYKMKINNFFLMMIVFKEFFSVKFEEKDIKDILYTLVIKNIEIQKEENVKMWLGDAVMKKGKTRILKIEDYSQRRQLNKNQIDQEKSQNKQNNQNSIEKSKNEKNKELSLNQQIKEKSQNQENQEKSFNKQSKEQSKNYPTQGKKENQETSSNYITSETTSIQVKQIKITNEQFQIIKKEALEFEKLEVGAKLQLDQSNIKKDPFEEDFQSNQEQNEELVFGIIDKMTDPKQKQILEKSLNSSINEKSKNVNKDEIIEIIKTDLQENVNMNLTMEEKIQSSQSEDLKLEMVDLIEMTDKKKNYLTFELYEEMRVILNNKEQHPEIEGIPVTLKIPENLNFQYIQFKLLTSIPWKVENFKIEQNYVKKASLAWARDIRKSQRLFQFNGSFNRVEKKIVGKQNEQPIYGDVLVIILEAGWIPIESDFNSPTNYKQLILSNNE